MLRQAHEARQSRMAGARLNSQESNNDIELGAQTSPDSPQNTDDESEAAALFQSSEIIDPPANDFLDDEEELARAIAESQAMAEAPQAAQPVRYQIQSHWSDIMSYPSDKWKDRSWNLLVHLMLLVIIAIRDVSVCTFAPVKTWIFVYCTFYTIETVI